MLLPWYTLLMVSPVRNFRSDLKSFNSRGSKYGTDKSGGADTKGINWDQFLCEHPNLKNMYDNGEMPMLRLSKRVGNMKSTKVEKMLVKHPYLMWKVLESENIRSIAEQLSQVARSSENENSKIENAAKRVKAYRGDVRKITNYFLRDLGIGNDSFVKIVIKAPAIFNYSIGKIKATIGFFLNQGFTLEQVNKILTLRPKILGYSITSKLRPALNKIKVIVGNDSYLRIISRYPQILTINVKEIDKRSRFLQYKLQLRHSRDIGYVYAGFPPTFYLSEDNISSKADFLKEVFNFDNIEMRDTMVTYPQLLGLSIESNLRPKIQFLLTDSENGGAGLSLEELKDIVLYQPSILGYSLENRLKPRIKRMKDNYISFNYAPMTLMSFSNEKFDQWLDLQITTWSIN